MKKFHLIVPLMIVAAIAATMIFGSPKVSSQQKSFQSVKVIPDDVKQILTNSCAACHNTGGNHMAMSKWNLAAWDTYPAAKQAKKAEAMCSAITKGKMPPGSFKKNNPDKVPTAAQIEVVCKWAGSLKKD
jgi:hypothetical protein